jgi:hypothetical protein
MKIREKSQNHETHLISTELLIKTSFTTFSDQNKGASSPFSGP